MFGLDAAALSLALGAGALAAVNPCGFALLPAYLTLFVLDEAAPDPVAAVLRAVRATLALAAGFAGVFLLFGLLVLPVAASIQAYLPVFTVALGLALAAAGGWLAAGRTLPALHLPRSGGATARRPVTANWRSMTGFGASYAVASLGCTLAPFLAVVLTSFRASEPAAGVALFLVYAAGMGLTVGVAAIAVALARPGIVTTMRTASSAVPRIAGGALAVTGLYVAWYGIWELRVLHLDAGRDPVIEVAAAIRNAIANQVTQVGAIGLAALTLTLLGTSLLWRSANRKAHQ